MKSEWSSFLVGACIAILVSAGLMLVAESPVPSHQYYMIFAIAFAIMVAVVLVSRPGVEGYGGPIKNITRIPFNRCQDICEGYYQKCKSQYGDLDIGWCDDQFRKACVAECRYTDYHQL